MARQFVAFFLLVFSSLVIVFGGYNCSQQLLPVQPDKTPIPVADDGGGDDDWGEPQHVPDRGEEDSSSKKGCKSRQYQDLVGKWGASVLVDLSERRLRDLRLGRESNYGVRCPRIFLDMEKVSGGAAYGGTLRITFEDTTYGGQKSIFPMPYLSGDSPQDNRFNTWRGDWKQGSRDPPVVNFSAIFESDFYDPERPDIPPLVAAVILRISKVRRVEIADGSRQALKGAGSVWFRMFRQFRSKQDVCHRQGGYAYLAQRTIPLPNKRCWLLDRGPYSCLPKGIGTLGSFNLSGSLTCYNKLLDFEYLDIHRAFNLESDQNHP